MKINKKNNQNKTVSNNTSNVSASSDEISVMNEAFEYLAKDGEKFAAVEDADEKLKIAHIIREIASANLCKEFVEHYKDKNNVNKTLKQVFFYGLSVFLILLTLGFVAISICTVVLGEEAAVIAPIVVSSIVGLIVSLIGTISIIAKYLFPINEDKEPLNYMMGMKVVDNSNNVTNNMNKKEKSKEQ